jgi:hypothetical protein
MVVHSSKYLNYRAAGLAVSRLKRTFGRLEIEANHFLPCYFVAISA